MPTLRAGSTGAWSASIPRAVALIKKSECPGRTVDAHAPGPTISGVTKRTRPAATGFICEGGSEGGRPTGFDRTVYRRRNEVERTINRLKTSRAIATRYDKRAYVFHGTVTVEAIRLWLGP
jgi:transposase